MSDPIDEVQGMTVNEALGHFNLFKAFDAAVKSRDLEAIVAVLKQAQLSEEQARWSASTYLARLVPKTKVRAARRPPDS